MSTDKEKKATAAVEEKKAADQAKEVNPPTENAETKDKASEMDPEKKPEQVETKKADQDAVSSGAKTKDKKSSRAAEIMKAYNVDVVYENPKGEFFLSENLAMLSVGQQKIKIVTHKKA